MIESYAYEAMKSIAAVQKDTNRILRRALDGRDFNRYPLTAHTFYVGRRMAITPLTWPAQRKYPKT